MDTCDYVEPALFGPDEPICPYTGLRTFTEDEAIYFRGREEHVTKCLTLLGAERFVMITGASGDGKSSLAFAGLLPEVRAGFLRGRYSNWAMATFRPERSPLRNMARALAAALQLENSAAAVENELEQGFSALVQLYQASALCPPAEPTPGFTEAEQRQQQRKAANLLIIVDQFEEFFTNPENYSGDGPNTAAQTVVNLLLETTRLAQAQKLPIYIVCTMRSDFVGQCVEFRGLIEQIGVSQYFVPRLLRHEFVEVIKEPALLSGNRISERLVQRLLYDIHFGQDQLPVLQHALRRIWLAADEGREEMDLLHYAMVGGLADELPSADQARFAQWRAGLSAAQQQFLLGQPSLRNVLDAHANQLYYEATSFYNADFQPPLPPGVAERVIERTFRALTRTDGQRVVRNRLSGAEITAIIGEEALPWPVVCRILRPFRQAGTTFLSPFLLEDADDRAVLPPDAVLDITHESLIRNWKHLSEWAISEAEDVRIAHDLLRQAGRWQASAENRGFLLPIGPYSYFAQWHERKQASASWLAYYVSVEEPLAAAPRQVQATAQHTLFTRFLEESRRHSFVSLLVARYGLGRLAMALLLPILLLGLGWWTWQQRTQQADYVAHSIIKDRLPFLASPYIPARDKADLLINIDRLKSIVYRPLGQDTSMYAFPAQLDALRNDTLALDIELAIYQQVNNEQYEAVECEHPWTRRVLLDLERRLSQAVSIENPTHTRLAHRRQQRALAVYTARMAMAMTHYLTYAQLRQAGGPLAPADHDIAGCKQRLLRHLLGYARQEVADTSGVVPRPLDFGFCLRVLLGQGNFSPAELQFLDGLNPLQPASAARRQFLRFFPREQAIYTHDGSTGHSGGYLTSAIIYAALRRPAQVAQCLDSLQRYTAQLGDETHGGMALVPYLVKYALLTPTNSYSLLRQCSAVGGVSFNELYAATVYSLLSSSPVNYSYAVAPSYQQQATSTDAASASVLVDAELLNVNRVSFSLAPAVRDSTWAALEQALPSVAAGQGLFEHDLSQPLSPTSAKYQRNELFLRAFLAKHHGIYHAEIRHDSLAAARSFAEFSRALAAFERVRQPAEMISPLEWSLGTAEEVGITQAGSVAQNPVVYLQQPTRPKTAFVGAYLTCRFDAFFLYQLRFAAASLTPDARLVRLLDSVTFVEAAFPDRYAGTRSSSLQLEALAREAGDEPNMVWIKAIRDVQLLTSEQRQRRNAFLYTISAALRDSARLRQLRVRQQVLPFVRQLARQPSFAQVPLRVALSNLAVALMHAGRAPEAWALAAALPGPFFSITAIRLGERAMLDDNRQQQTLLDSFLTAYQQRIIDRPLDAATSVIPLLYWWPATTGAQARRFEQRATFLIREGRPLAQEVGPSAMCKGRSLADNSHEAFADLPAYQPERFLQRYYNDILLSLAHLKTAKAGDGWKEYDEKILLHPADYQGHAN